MFFHALPVWWTFRARKIAAHGGLSKAHRVRFLAPAGLVGGLGLLDFLDPFGFVSGIVHGATGGFGAYWVFLSISQALVILAGATWVQCETALAESNSRSASA